MNDIFDDIFGYDDYAYEGYSSDEIDYMLACEAFDAIPDYDDYDPAYEGIGDVMGKIGNRIKEGARNLIRKIKEAFRKLGQWIKDRFAGFRARAAAKENSELQKVLDRLDQQVKVAKGTPNYDKVKTKVDRIKRNIMRAIDASKGFVSKVNSAMSDFVTVFKMLKATGDAFISGINAQLMSGMNKDNNYDGNELVDRANRAVDKANSIARFINDAADDTTIDKEDIKEIGSLKAILNKIKFDKVDKRAALRAADEAQEICDRGNKAALKLEAVIDNQRLVYKAGSTIQSDDPSVNPAEFKNTDIENITNKKEQIDKTSKEHLSALLTNWYEFTNQVAKASKLLNDFTVKIMGKDVGTRGRATGNIMEKGDALLTKNQREIVG